jgi:hypothetical protein
MKIFISLALVAAIVIMISFSLQAALAQYHPVLIAQGEQIRLEAEQAALAAEQARIQQQAEWELKQQERERITNEMVASYKAALPWVMGIGTITVCMLIGMVGLTVVETLRGIGRATVIAAHTAAHQVRLDPRTGQYPLVMAGNMLVDPNTGMALLTDREREANPRMIVAANSVRLSGVAVNNTKVHLFGNNQHAGPMVAGAMHPQLSAVDRVSYQNLLEAGDYEISGNDGGTQGSEPG